MKKEKKKEEEFEKRFMLWFGNTDTWKNKTTLRFVPPPFCFITLVFFTMFTSFFCALL